MGGSEIERKTGERLKIEPNVGSLLFRKKDGEWTIIYAHETAAAPVAIEANH